IERFDERREIVGVSVHVVAVPGLARATVAAPVVGDAAISVGSQEEHLIFPGIGRERPAMAEDNGLTLAPVLVIDLRAVFSGDGTHGNLLWLVRGLPQKETWSLRLVITDEVKSILVSRSPGAESASSIRGA